MIIIAGVKVKKTGRNLWIILWLWNNLTSIHDGDEVWNISPVVLFNDDFILSCFEKLFISIDLYVYMTDWKHSGVITILKICIHTHNHFYDDQFFLIFTNVIRRKKFLTISVLIKKSFLFSLSFPLFSHESYFRITIVIFRIFIFFSFVACVNIAHSSLKKSWSFGPGQTKNNNIDNDPGEHRYYSWSWFMSVIPLVILLRKSVRF